MSNMNNNRRYSGGGGRGDSHHRSSAPNYASVVANGNYNGNNKNGRVPSSNARNGAYPNNYVVTHRVEQQYSVQVINPAEQQQQQLHRQHASNVVPVAPIQKVPPPPPHISVEAPQPSSLTVSVVPYAGRGNMDNHNTPVSSSTTPSSSTSPQPEEGDDEEIHELKEGGFHYKKLGEMFGEIYIKSSQQLKRLQSTKNLNRKLLAEKEVLQTQLVSVQQEKEAQTKRYEAAIQFEQNETAKMRQECLTWREQAIQLNGQLETVNVQLSSKTQSIDALRNEILQLKTQNEKYVQRIKELEQSEQRLKSEIESNNKLIEQLKREVTRKCDELDKADSRYKEKLKDLKQLDDEAAAMKRDLSKKLANEQKKVQDLESNIVEWHAKYKSLKETCDKSKNENKRLESSKEELELKTKELSESLERKGGEIISISEERDSLQIQKKAQETMLKEQNAQISQLKTNYDTLVQKNADLKKQLDEEMQLKKRILDEQMELYTRPTLLNQLMQQKLQSVLALSTPPPGLLQLKSSECTSPEASEEILESSSAEQQEEGKANNGNNNNKGQHETLVDGSRKRKYSASSTSDGKTIDAKVSRDDVSSTDANLGNVSGTPEIKFGGSKETDAAQHGSQIQSSSRGASSNGGDEKKLASPTRSRWTGGEQNGVTTQETDTIRIKFPKPSINLRKTK